VPGRTHSLPVGQIKPCGDYQEEPFLAHGN
jgi:hypothetical protein